MAMATGATYAVTSLIISDRLWFIYAVRRYPEPPSAGRALLRVRARRCRALCVNIILNAGLTHMYMHMYTCMYMHSTSCDDQGREEEGSSWRHVQRRAMIKSSAASTACPTSCSRRTKTRKLKEALPWVHMCMHMRMQCTRIRTCASRDGGIVLYSPVRVPGDAVLTCVHVCADKRTVIHHDAIKTYAYDARIAAVDVVSNRETPSIISSE